MLSLQINVYELGATYLKLRGALHLTNPMPEVDPAIYNLRFALKLDLGTDVNIVATDASRLLRRFKADWMTQGRRPAGVCGACIIIAARMSNYLRTPEEVAQVVKVSPSTIRKRLLEFAQTEVANKTVVEWRSLSDKELLQASPSEDPPVVKQVRAKAEALRMQALQKAQEDVLAQAEEVDEDELAPRKKRRKETRLSGASTEPDVADDEDRNLDELETHEWVADIVNVQDDPREEAKHRRKQAQVFRRVNRQVNEPTELDDADLGELVSVADVDGREAVDDEKEEDEPDSEAELREKEERRFDNWDDGEATIDYLGKRYFSEEERLLKLTAGQMRERVRSWLRDREPREVVREIEVVEFAHRMRDRSARTKPEEVFPDLDDDELDAYYQMNEDDVRARARLWLSQNGKWLEEEKGG